MYLSSFHDPANFAMVFVGTESIHPSSAMCHYDLALPMIYAVCMWKMYPLGALGVSDMLVPQVLKHDHRCLLVPVGL